MNTDCYKFAVGLSRADCPCREDGAPDEFSRSDSGIFIDQIIPFGQLEGLADCASPTNPWKQIERAREEAILAFIADSNSLLIRKNRLKREPFRGGLGEATGREVLSLTKQYAGVRFACAPVRSGVLNVSKIGCVMDQSGTFDLLIFDNLNRQVGDPITMTAIAGRHTQTVVNRVLPLYDPFAKPLEYFFVYDLWESGLPRATKAHCGCGGFDPQFNIAAPYFNPGNKGAKAWANWAMIGGWTGDALDEFDNCPATTTQITNGLTFEISMNCSPSETLCSGELDFKANPLAAAIAYAIQFKAADILADKLLIDTNLNRQTLINRDAMTAARNEHRAKYMEHVTYITDQADVRAGDCLECKSVLDMKIAGILS